MLTEGPDAVSSPDNGSAYRATIHALACKALGIKHLRTRPYRPRRQAPIERLHTLNRNNVLGSYT
jgi:transposase InsO family protein